jgi:dUTP pyrophosphatase
MYDEQTAPLPSSTPVVLFRRLHPTAVPPRKSTKLAHCYDLFLSPAVAPVFLWPGRQVRVKTGLALAIPSGWVGKVYPRSGNADKYRVHLGNGTGIIDADFRGELEVLLERSAYCSSSLGAVQMEHDKAIAQIAFERSENVSLIEVDSLEDTERGAGGFGHTDETGRGDSGQRTRRS